MKEKKNEKKKIVSFILNRPRDINLTSELNQILISISSCKAASVLPPIIPFKTSFASSISFSNLLVTTCLTSEGVAVSENKCNNFKECDKESRE